MSAKNKHNNSGYEIAKKTAVKLYLFDRMKRL